MVLVTLGTAVGLSKPSVGPVLVALPRLGVQSFPSSLGRPAPLRLSLDLWTTHTQVFQARQQPGLAQNVITCYALISAY